jgi:hypothetical protein
MSQYQERLRAAGIINTWDILTKFAAEGLDVACDFSGKGPARSYECAKTRVWRPKHKTDPNAAWYDYGRKTFVGTREESMPLALKWASEKYGITQWVPCPTDRNAKIPKEVLDALKIKIP